MVSMTGFGRGELLIDGYQYTVEIKSVNHRYLDLRFKLPLSLQAYESVFAETIRTQIQRGSVDVSIRQKLASTGKTFDGSTRFLIDQKAAASFFEAAHWLQTQHTLAAPSLDAVLATGKILLPVEETAETPTLPPALRALVEQTVSKLVAERKREGEQTRLSLQATVKSLGALSEQWKTNAEVQHAKIRERLQKRLQQWNLSSSVDAQRLELEVAFLADRSDISEEIQRFEAHLQEFSKLTQAKEPVGRKLDFLTQELHRETNTIASKADDLGLSRLAVEAKTAIEKLREQVQNVE